MYKANTCFHAAQYCFGDINTPLIILVKLFLFFFFCIKIISQFKRSFTYPWNRSPTNGRGWDVLKENLVYNFDLFYRLYFINNTIFCEGMFVIFLWRLGKGGWGGQSITNNILKSLIKLCWVYLRVCGFLCQGNRFFKKISWLSIF